MKYENGQFPNPFIDNGGRSGAPGSIDNIGLAHQIAAKINTDATHGQIVRALKKYNESITPVTYTLSNTFSATNAIATMQQQFDSAYYFFGYAWSIVAQSTDKNFVVNSLQITQQTSIIINDYPCQAVIGLTAQYAPLFWCVPANSTVTLTVTNGSTTAANLCYFSFYGTRVPAGLVNQLRSKNNI